MEKVLTYEDKIRKAEEIYARRNRNGTRRNITTVNIRENKKKTVLKKLILQMLICIGLYSIIYLIHTTDYVFSENVRGNTKQILSYDVDLANIYNTIKEFIAKIMNTDAGVNDSAQITQNDDAGVNDSAQITQNDDAGADASAQTNQNDDAGTDALSQETIQNNDVGADDSARLEETNQTESAEQNGADTPVQTQMEQDANQIKQNYSLIQPLNGVISSEFGEREVNNAVITPEHYGIDIAANEGTNIVASMDGEVISASVSSSYRKFYKNTK